MVSRFKLTPYCCLCVADYWHRHGVIHETGSRKYITHCNAARGEPSYGHGQNAQKTELSLQAWFMRCTREDIDMQS